MRESDLYIKRLLKKLENIDDKELVLLIKKLIEERNYLSEIANIDTLTGLNNRRILKRIRECSAVVMCDIDDFKQVNDNYGHDTGDMVIKAVTQVIKKNTRAKDYVCRFGGDEFFIAFVSCPESVICNRIETIRQQLCEMKLLPDNGYNVTISVGFVINSNFENIDELIKKADKALYESKKNGRNMVTKYTNKNKVLRLKNKIYVNKKM
ncbi:MAG: GGDEF domain-containing protein [Bacilli bacterium]|nr:GGDEF domain-containing protein [Bacilli bacterium]